MCFNPRTHVGCDMQLTDILLLTKGFNPRTHVGCDALTPILPSEPTTVSIHAPT